MTAEPGGGPTPDPPIVQFDRISKRFPGVVALSEVSFAVGRGSCHALCGENGAGKSTLGKILAGLYLPDEGRILLDGAPVRFASPRDARAAGIAIVHQEPTFCRNLSVAENLCLAALPRHGPIVDRVALRARAQAILDSVGLVLDVDRPVEHLTPGQRQLLQIAAAAGTGARVILFDEPTSSLGEHEAAQLFALMARVRGQGATCLYVSHRLREIFQLCDAVTVLRDGTHVATRPRAGLDERGLVQMMIGRNLEAVTPAHLQKAPGPERLKAKRLTSPGRFEGVDLSVRAGEVVGLAGLVGAGRSEVAQALFGLDRAATGTILVDGEAVTVKDPTAALRLGLGLVPEDRQRQGLVLMLGGRANTTLPILDRLARLLWVRRAEEEALVEDQFARLRVRIPQIDFPVAGLSGGNQQKIVLARWLAARCRILILDEPTRGVDVGAKAEIHALIDGLAADGSAVLLISSEMPELLALSTRIVVLRSGRVVGELARAEASEEAVAHLMTGVEVAPANTEIAPDVVGARMKPPVEGRLSREIAGRDGLAAETRAVRTFRERFGGEPTLVVHAPGRVNLLGEHTDYNEGFVLPMALHLGAWIALRPRADDRVVLRSLDFGEEQEFELSRLHRGQGWIEYVKGTGWALQEAGASLRGWDGVVTGEVPIGAGLASSAALEVAAARAFVAAADLPWQPVTAARLAQRAENEWVGVQCGIMDQLVIAAGREGHALLIDCRHLTTRPIPLPPGTVVAVLDTSTRRDLVDSTYNARRARCEEATRRCGVRSLRDLSLSDLEQRAGALTDEQLRLARHVVTENARTLAAAEAMMAEDAASVGALMDASHRSLRDDFGVSSPALDAIVAAAQAAPGCFGARMTGAGLAGCAVALVEESAAGAFVAETEQAYGARSGLQATVHLSSPCGGTDVRAVG